MQISQRARLPLFIAYIIFITLLFALPGTAFPSDDWMSRIWFDKWLHIGIFFVLAILFGWTFPGRRNRWIIFFVIAAVYGLFIEFAQNSFIPNRSFDIGDWLADLVGIVSGILIFRRYAKK